MHADAISPTRDAGCACCADKPLHWLTRWLEGHHAPIREELDLVARLAEEEFRRHGHRHPDVLPALHLAVCLLRDAVRSYFAREEALLFPNARLLEDDLPYRLSLHALMPEVLYEHRQISDQIAQLRSMTRHFVPPSTTPLLIALFAALARIVRQVSEQLLVEERSLFPQLLHLEHPGRRRAS